MKSEDILRAIGEVDDELIERASKKTPNPFWRWSGIAAALILVIGIAYVVSQQDNLKPPTPPIEVTEAPETEAPSEEEPASEYEFPSEEAPETEILIECDYTFAYLDDFTIILQHDYAAYDSLVEYADTYNMDCCYYSPEEITASAHSAIIERAISGGANVIVTRGSLYGPAIVETAPKYPEVTFICLNMKQSDLTMESSVTDPFEEYGLRNVLAIEFQSEFAGYLAGYIAVYEGYTSLGFGTELLISEAPNTVSGFVQGVQDAAKEAGCLDEICIRLTDAEQLADFSAEDRVAQIEAWCESGVQFLASEGHTFAPFVDGLEMAVTIDPYMYVDGSTFHLRWDTETLFGTLFPQLFSGELSLGRAERVPYYMFVEFDYYWAERYAALYTELLDGTRECPSKTTFNPDDYEIEIIWE